MEIHDHEGLVAMGQVDAADLYQVCSGLLLHKITSKAQPRQSRPGWLSRPSQSARLIKSNSVKRSESSNGILHQSRLLEWKI